jgi:hypothetical protein
VYRSQSWQQSSRLASPPEVLNNTSKASQACGRVNDQSIQVYSEDLLDLINGFDGDCVRERPGHTVKRKIIKFALGAVSRYFLRD